LLLWALTATAQIVRASAAWQMLQVAKLLAKTPFESDPLALAHQKQALSALDTTKLFEWPLQLALLVAFIAWFRYLDRAQRGLGKTLVGFLVPGVNLVLPFLWLRRLARDILPAAQRARAWLVEALWASTVVWIVANIGAWRVSQQALAGVPAITTGAGVDTQLQSMSAALSSVGTSALITSGIAIVAAATGAALVWSLGNAQRDGLAPDQQ
jgi:hypothetical protein